MTRPGDAPVLALPTLDGVGPSTVALPPGHWPHMLAFLVQHFPGITEADWLARMARQHVVDEQGQPITPGQAYRPHSKLFYYRTLQDEPEIPFTHSILFEDEHLLAVDKPHFLPVTPSGRFLHQTLLVRLKKELGCDTLTPLHRLDRETAGVVLFGKRPEERNTYQALLRERAVDKTYETIAPLQANLAFPLTRRSRIVEDEEHFFRQRETDGPPNSETQVALLRAAHGMGRYRLTPITGKTHQLRVHMAALGLPIVNDLYYPEVQQSREQLGTEDTTRPLQLLARSIAFTDPVTREPRRFETSRSLLPLDSFSA